MFQPPSYVPVLRHWFIIWFHDLHPSVNQSTIKRHYQGASRPIESKPGYYNIPCSLLQISLKQRHLSWHSRGVIFHHKCVLTLFENKTYIGLKLLDFNRFFIPEQVFILCCMSLHKICYNVEVLIPSQTWTMLSFVKRFNAKSFFGHIF